ncbi:hypothetical protein IQ215_03230 [Cyanobacterium stanieri LEGE 03274]|uniref:PEP-CTERM sorting domain-containing protein n=1 Tax=Cyanobacterium stanieri LEGE 03274 TaxID=1828756 RepID=A0ABR9V1C7_9CHRO|nr:hypothetical protein [Cyanobacterium stanieri]MBE9221700.1 hypothetical protein [Cyanobacterium stanieri LEGE 03274]
MKNNPYIFTFPYNHKALALTASLTITTLLSSISYTESAKSAVLIQGFETGGNVELTLSGSLDITSTIISPNVFDTVGGGVLSSWGLIYFQSITEGIFISDRIDTPSNLIFGPNQSDFSPSSVSGFFSIVASGNTIYLDSEYSSGDPLTGTMIFNNTTFADLGIIPGTYESGFNNGADTITFRFGNITTTPEPSIIFGSIFVLGSGVLFGNKKKI